MTWMATCDCCGERIENDQLLVTISAEGLLGGHHLDRDLGHYHGDGEDSCFDRVHEAIKLASEASLSLAQLPVAEPTRPSVVAPTIRAAVATAGFDGTDGLWRLLDAAGRNGRNAYRILYDSGRGATTVAELCELSYADLLAMPGMGRRCADAVVAALERGGLRLRGASRERRAGAR